MRKKNILLLTVIIFIIIFVVFRFAEARRKEWDVTKASYEEMLENLSMEKYYEAKKVEYFKILNESSFCNVLSQEKIITVLNNYTGKNNIQILNIKFSNGEFAFVDKDIEIVESDDGDLGRCQTMGLTIEFKSSFKVLLDFIDDINENESDISINDIRIISWDENLIYVVLDMEFYAVPIG